MSESRKFQFWLSVDEAASIKRAGYVEPGEYNAASALYRNDMEHIRNVMQRLTEAFAGALDTTCNPTPSET